MSGRPPVVAIFNTSPDTVDLLRIVLEQAGFVVFGAYSYDMRDGKIDITDMVKQHQPDLIIYDVAPPYDRNWRLFQHLCSMPALNGLPAFRRMKFLKRPRAENSGPSAMLMPASSARRATSVASVPAGSSTHKTWPPCGLETRVLAGKDSAMARR